MSQFGKKADEKDASRAMLGACGFSDEQVERIDDLVGDAPTLPVVVIALNVLWSPTCDGNVVEAIKILRELRTLNVAATEKAKRLKKFEVQWREPSRDDINELLDAAIKLLAGCWEAIITVP